LHKAQKISELFDKHLGHGYANEVVDIAADYGFEVKSQTVRSVRNGFGLANLPVLNILIEFAKEKEAERAEAQEKFKNLTTTI
jgi:hypothetical protein